jgi:imidazolonepropionase-like amidohydrolase
VNRSLLIRNVSVLERGGSFSDPLDVAVEDGVVSAVGANLPTEDCPTYDLAGLWLMPGVFDCHLHISCSTTDESERLRTPITRWCLEAARNFRATLECGVTFVRDAGGADAGMRDAIDRGYVAGPRLQISINMLSQTAGHGDMFLQGLGAQTALTPSWRGKAPDVLDGVDDMRKVVRQLLRDGADWIKLCSTGGVMSPFDSPHEPQFTREEIEVAVFEAGRRGKSVCAHAYGGEGLTTAVAAGVRSVEHGMYLTEEQAAQMAAAGCFLCPTLAIGYDAISWAEEGRVLPPHAAPKVLERIKPFLGDCVQVAHDAGVKIMAGTDYIHREEHGHNLIELWHLHNAGLSAKETLLAATRNGAELCGVEDRYGTIAPGYVFDAILLGQDPSDMRIFSDTGSVVGVFKGGDCVKGHELLEERADAREVVPRRLTDRGLTRSLRQADHERELEHGAGS